MRPVEIAYSSSAARRGRAVQRAAWETLNRGSAMDAHEHIVEGGCTNRDPMLPRPRTNLDPKLRKPRTTLVGALFSWIRRLIRWPSSRSESG
jgi:hypothetical protein